MPDEQLIPTQVLTTAQVIGENKWLPGRGRRPADIMIIGHHPQIEDTAAGYQFSGSAYNDLAAMMQKHGLDINDAYCTNLVKYAPKGKKPKAADVKACLDMLYAEIWDTNPKVIVCLGGEALKHVIKDNKCKISTYRGIQMQYPDDPNIAVVPTYALSYLEYNPAAETALNHDWELVHNILGGVSTVNHEVNYTVASDYDYTSGIVAELLGKAVDEPLMLTVDCEWHGKHWQDPDGYLRTVQIAWSDSNAFVFEMYGELTDDGAERLYTDESLERIAALLENPNIMLAGHNVIADGEWLLKYNIDIRPNTVFDTMIAEHTLNSSGVFNLTALTEKYTDFGKYDSELTAWKDAHKAETKHGFGRIPRDMLISYAAKDAAATYAIMECQLPKLQELGYTQPRGEFPSLFKSSMNTQLALYEIQHWGMKVDPERLDMITALYHNKLQQLETDLIMVAAQNGMPDFNFRSPKQVAELLFTRLGLTPISTTDASGGKSWDEVANLSNIAEIAPSTDKTTLEILQDKHPAVKLLRDLRKIDHACKTWMPTNYDPAEHDETTKGGGLKAKIWPDGRIHASFSQLKETGRFSSKNPNMQNFPKRAEGDIKRIFGDNCPPNIRTVFVPEDGYYILEADWKQAELFVLAGLSGDRNMYEALTTPGKDLHDLTAITAFGITVLDTDDNPVDEGAMLALAASDMSAFEEFQGSLRYLDQRGNIMDRKTFKNTVRVSAKNLNFGIPYGRGAHAIAVQVKAETGSSQTIDALAAEIQVMMDAWKTTTYPDAWAYMCKCADDVLAQGYVENPWGRRRNFPQTTDSKRIAAMQREAQNFPIQSTVADTCIIALRMLQEYRKEHVLNYRIINQVHDAIMLEVPKDEVEEAKQACYATMANIAIPIPDNPLKLDIDIDLMTRWGEKVK